MFKRLESTTTAKEAEHLQLGLMRLNEVEKSIQLRILHRVRVSEHSSPFCLEPTSTRGLSDVQLHEQSIESF